MSSQTSPLLGPSNGNGRPASRKSTRSNQSHVSTESTPLLSRHDEGPRYGDDYDETLATSGASDSLNALRNQREPSKRKPWWPSLIALSTLSVVVLLIMAGAFLIPAAVEEYSKEAMVFEPTNLSIDSFTTSGVRARVQGTFVLDASRVKNSAVRNVGRAGTWVASKIESGQSKVEVYLPEYGNVLLGTATVPPIVVNIRNGHLTHINFVTDVEPGEIDGIRRIANDWLEGRLGDMRIIGKANVSLKSGMIPLGVQSISESLVFQGQSLYSPASYGDV
jgi:hypothetical protein